MSRPSIARIASRSRRSPSCRWAAIAGGERNWSPVVDAVLGGWQFSAKFEWQVGQPLVFNNNTYFDPACGDPKALKATWGDVGDGVFRGVDVPVIDLTCFYTLQQSAVPQRGRTGGHVPGRPTIQLGQSNIRTFPTTMPDVRFMNHHLLDFGLTKNFRIRDRVRVQVQDRSAERDQLHAVRLGQRDI